MVEWIGRHGVLLPSPTREPKLARACALLLTQLAQGSQPAEYLTELAAKEGISLRTLKSAKVLLGVKTRRVGWGRGSRIWWLLDRRRIECKTDDDVWDANIPFWEHFWIVRRGPQQIVSVGFESESSDPFQLVGVPTEPHGAFAWVDLEMAQEHARSLRRGAKARGEKVLPEIDRARVVGRYPRWWTEPRGKPGAVDQLVRQLRLR